MERRFRVPLLAVGLSTVLLAGVHKAHATLGESADSVSADRKALSAVRRTTTTRASYTIQEIKSDSVTVREYISSSGIVFGIAWNGLTHPDLTPLLGSYAAEYKEAKRQTPRQPGRRHSQIRGSRVVVEKWGHMRNLQGRAYDPNLVPPGVTVNEIK